MIGSQLLLLLDRYALSLTNGTNIMEDSFGKTLVVQY